MNKKSCKTCKHLGKVFEYLKSYQKAYEGRECVYPLPWHIIPKTVSMVPEAGYNCKVYSRKENKNERN